MIPKLCLSVPRERNHHSFVNISPTLVIDTSMESFSQVLHRAGKNPGFILKKTYVGFIKFLI